MTDLRNDATVAAGGQAARPASAEPARRSAASAGACRGLGSRTAKEGRVMRGAEAVVASLEAEGVDVVFGYPGGQAIKLYDALYDMTDAERANQLIENGTIEIAPLAFMRGRTLNDSFIILDEAQNSTPEQMKMFLTRLGFGSKIVVTGDVSQTDLPRGISGLAHVRPILEGTPDIAFCDFTGKDVVRHSLVAAIVAAYERAGRKA